MIDNNWRKRLEKSGVAQDALAEALGYNKGVMSQVCGGVRVMPIDDLMTCCKMLGCEPADLYSEDTLSVIYKADIPKKTRESATVRLRPKVMEAVDRLVEDGIYLNRGEAVNALCWIGAGEWAE